MRCVLTLVMCCPRPSHREDQSSLGHLNIPHAVLAGQRKRRDLSKNTGGAALSALPARQSPENSPLAKVALDAPDVQSTQPAQGDVEFERFSREPRWAI